MTGVQLEVGSGPRQQGSLFKGPCGQDYLSGLPLVSLHIVPLEVPSLWLPPRMSFLVLWPSLPSHHPGEERAESTELLLVEVNLPPHSQGRKWSGNLAGKLL